MRQKRLKFMMPGPNCCEPRDRYCDDVGGIDTHQGGRVGISGFEIIFL